MTRPTHWPSHPPNQPYSHPWVRVHTCTCMLNMINMDASMSVAICNFYTCIHVCACMCVCVHVCVCVCACVCMCMGTPPSLQIKFNKSWTNRDNSILFEDSLPLNTPELKYTIVTPPPSSKVKETQIYKITISLKWIKIIQFCLKIWDSWTLLHSYRLGLMSRWGCPIPHGTFMFWIQTSAPVTLQ